MHIHKPDDTLLLTGYANRAGQPALTVTVGYVCNADGSRMSEQDAWKWLAPLFPDEPFDLSEKKAGGGFGVAGDACAPAGTTIDGLTVRAGVGDLQRHLLVQGNRVWVHDPIGWQATTALPFERMSIGLARAYGGPEWRDNPYGQGHRANTDDFEGMPLPNVELPDQPVLKPTDTPAVATLGSHPLGGTTRTRWLGALDKTWERDRLPWLPDDTDPRWFDRFDPLQCQPAYWRGDEPWFAENMHPRHGTLRGRLPGLRPRLLLRTVADPDRHLELDLDLDTVWLMPNDERVVVLYRSQTGVKREDAKDILGLAVFTETLAEPPRSLAHWSQAWREATEGDLAGPIAAPAPIAPETLAKIEAARQAAEKQASEFEASLKKEIEQELQKAEAEADEHLRSAGINVKEMKAHASNAPPLKVEEPGELNLPKEPQAYLAALEAHIDKELKQAEEQARQYLTQQGINVDAMQAHAAAASKPDMAATVAAMAANLPIPESQRQAYVKELTEFQKEMDGLEANLQSQFRQAEQEAAASAALRDAYGAPRDDLGDTPKGPRERLTREALLDRLRTGASAAWTELEDQDLSGLDLHGLDLSMSILRQCDLRGTTLSEANLTEALLVDCNLDAAKLEHTSLVRAQLERCNLRDAQLASADFSSARLSECSAERARLDASRWDDAQVAECSFEAATLKKATGKRAGFTGCRMPGIDASGVQFDRANFEHCALDGATFNNAHLIGSTLLACQASHAHFENARLAGLRTLQETQLDRADLHGADMQDASLQDTSLTHAILREANLDRALVKECDLTGTDAWRMTARNADFTDSRITQASWRGANLMQATLRQATILDTDLTGTNLHATQTRTATVQGLQLDQALMTRCRLLQEYNHG